MRHHRAPAAEEIVEKRRCVTDRALLSEQAAERRRGGPAGVEPDLRRAQRIERNHEDQRIRAPFLVDFDRGRSPHDARRARSGISSRPAAKRELYAMTRKPAEILGLVLPLARPSAGDARAQK